MNAASARKETAQVLGVPEESLGYITEELLKHYKDSAEPADTSSGGADGSVVIAGNWGTYGNSITFDENTVYWKQGTKGTANYGCGTSESWSAGKFWCKYIIEKGTCAGGMKWKFIGNYQG